MKIDNKFYKIFPKTNENNVSFERVIVTELNLTHVKKLSTVRKRNLSFNFLSFQAIKQLVLRSGTRRLNTTNRMNNSHLNVCLKIQ